MSKKRVLITGASGFLGTNLFKHIVKRKREQLFLLCKPGSNWRMSKKELKKAKAVYEVDLLSSRAVKKAVEEIQPDIVFNLAVAGLDGSTKHWTSIVKVNVLGIAHLLDALKDNPPQHFIQMGTCFEYGSSLHNMRETDPLNPLTIYSASKVSSTFLALTIGRTHSIPVTVFRAFTLYGPYDNPFRLISWTILNLLENQTTIKLTEGKKEQVKDFLYVEDFVRFLTNFMEKSRSIDPYQIFNIGHNQPISIEDLIILISNLMKKSVNIKVATPKEFPFSARKTEYSRVVSDSRKARKVLGWKPKTSLRVGLKKTINWFKRHKDLYSYD